MTKMKVLYYTSTAFMDVSVEVINVLKSLVELHVLIELTPGSKNENIIDINTLPEDEVFVSPSKLMTQQDYQHLQPYISGVASINFVVHARKSMATSFSTSVKVFQYIKKIQPAIFHLEALQIRSVGLLPSILLVKKLLVAVHDPLPHTGETSWKINLTRFAFFRYPVTKGYLLYSQFARQQFDRYYPQLKSDRYVLRLNPYSYYQNYLNGQEKIRKHILFFGRLSPYKGIDVLLKAFPDVLKKFPDEHLVIAGKGFDGYEPDTEVIQRNKENITVLNRYITNEELVTLVSQAKFIVCPYKDATQSGVLMTAYALDTPVIATDVGAFAEYIQDTVTGMLVPVNDPVVLAEKMVVALENDFYNVMKSNLGKKNKTNSWASENKEVFLKAYAH